MHVQGQREACKQNKNYFFLSLEPTCRETTMSDSESSTEDSEIRTGVTVLSDTDEQEQGQSESSDGGVELEEREAEESGDDEDRVHQPAAASDEGESDSDKDGTEAQKEGESNVAPASSMSAAVPSADGQDTATAKSSEMAADGEVDGGNGAEEREASPKKAQRSEKSTTANERQRGSKSVTPKPTPRKTHSRRATEVRTTSGPHVRRHAHESGRRAKDTSVTRHLDIAKEDSDSSVTSGDDADDLYVADTDVTNRGGIRQFSSSATLILSSPSSPFHNTV